MRYTLRNETPADRRAVEELTRTAFWNLYVPGCNEHFLVHRMREHPDFLPALNIIAEIDGRIIGSIMYTRSTLIDADGERLGAVTFGPVSVHPDFQRKGVGTALIRHTAAIVKSEGFPAIIIFGNPSNYVGSGFVSSITHHISASDGSFPTSMLILPLNIELLNKKRWKFYESSVFEFPPDEAAEFDKSFPVLEKKYQPSQEIFSILSRSFIREE